MPEGHTTHRLARRHQRCYGGSPVAVSSPQSRFAKAAEVLGGRVLKRAEAHGKHLFHVYDFDLVVHVHLGLYGSFAEAALPVQPPRGQVRMRLIGATHWTDLRGPNACELLTKAETDAVRIRWDPTRYVATPTRSGPGSASPLPELRWPRC
jgi:endonuclease VIII